MAETWSPPHTYVGRNGSWSSGNTFGGKLASKISGPNGVQVKDHDSMVKDGWTLTGYKTATIHNPGYGKSGGMTQTKQIPIYTKLPVATAAPQAAPAAAAAATPDAAIEPKLDTARIAAAKEAAAPFATASKPPSLYSVTDPTIEPYKAADQFGIDANTLFSRLIDRNEAIAKQQTVEMGAALDYQAQRFNGAVPKLEEWRSYYEPLKKDIMSA